MLGLASMLLATGLFATRGAALEDLDAANLHHALTHYDLALHMPHFPGYPVFVASARAVFAVTGDAVLALQLPGLGAWVGALALLWLAVDHHLGRRPAWLAWGLAAASPLTWLAAGRTGADALGVALATGAVAAVALSHEGAKSKKETSPVHSARWLALGVVLASLAVGTRASLVPMFTGIMLVVALHPARRSALGTGLLALALWVIPFSAAAGPEVLDHASAFLVGHFTSWGGTAFIADSESTGLIYRAGLWYESLLIHGLGLPDRSLLFTFIIGPVGFCAVVGAVTVPRRVLAFLAVVAIPYMLWIWIGQNPEKPRHLLPLLPLLAVVLGAGLARMPKAFGAIAPAVLLAITLPLGWTHAHVPSPAAQLADWLVETQRPDHAQVFTGQSERVLGVLASGFRVEYAPDMVEVNRRLSTLRSPPPVLLWTNEIQGADQAPSGYGPPRQLAQLGRSTRVKPHGAEITVWTADLIQAARR